MTNNAIHNINIIASTLFNPLLLLFFGDDVVDIIAVDIAVVDVVVVLYGLQLDPC